MKHDPVNNPNHYGNGKIECIDYIKDFLTEEEWIGYLRGNIAKYMHRWRYKGGLEDLKKAGVYHNWLVETIKESEENEDKYTNFAFGRDGFSLIQRGDGGGED